MTAVVTGWAVHLPGFGLADAVERLLGTRPGPWAAVEAVPPADAARLLGRRGMLYKDPATRLALCAVHRAMGRAPLERPAGPVDPATAVVACGNLGSVGTVAKVARAVAAEGGRAASVLDAPNVSPNVVATTVASWFGLGGPNLAVCSGDAAAADGFRLACLLLRSRRAERVVLVGAEPADDVAVALRAADPAPFTRLPLRAGAAAVVLERSRPARRSAVAGHAPTVHRVRTAADPAPVWGDHYGAQGIVSLAVAAHLAVDDGLGHASVPSDGAGGTWTVQVGAGVEEVRR